MFEGPLEAKRIKKQDTHQKLSNKKWNDFLFSRFFTEDSSPVNNLEILHVIAPHVIVPPVLDLCGVSSKLLQIFACVIYKFQEGSRAGCR